MTYTRFGPFNNGSYAKPINAAFLDAVEAELIALDAGYTSAGAPKGLIGAGIDPTGASVSTSAVQTFFNNCVDGDTVSIANGAVINLDGTITISKRIRLTGNGELRWTAGIAGASMFSVTADGCVFDGLYLTNPNHLANQTGPKTAGIYLQASHCRVIGCRIVGQQQAIAVDPGGEWHDFAIIGNEVQDVPGSGDGPTSASGNGEDRGDGIVCWGATATITGNRVNALNGTDARVGIHVESLPQSEQTTYIHGDSLVAIVGNVVTGKFRRGIVSESVINVTISNNAVSDPTWWGVALINTTGCLASSNTIYWTRTSADAQGSAWSPARSAFMVYGSGYNNRVQSNTVTLGVSGVLDAAVTAQTAGNGNQDDLVISGNTFTGLNMYSGIGLNGGQGTINRPLISTNKISGHTNYGIYLYNCGDFTATGNRVDGASGTNTAEGLHAEANTSGARVDNNTFYWCSTAVHVYNRNALTTVNNNMVYQAGTGFDLYGCAAALLNSNLTSSVTNKTANLPSATVGVGNN